ASSEESLYQNVCRAAIKGGKFNIASILVPDSKGWLNAVSTAGYLSPVDKPVRVSIDPARPEGHGLAGVAFRSGQAYISNDFLNDPSTAPWHDVSRARQIASAAAFPLFKRKQCVAIFLFFSSETDTFDEDIIKVLSSLAENVSYAL